MENFLCVVCKRDRQVIDPIVNGRGMYGGEPLADMLARDADYETMLLDDFGAWKAALQRTPIRWLKTTRDAYDEALNCLDPAYWERRAFVVGEPYDHDAGNGLPRAPGYRMDADGQCYYTSRPVTIPEFKQALKEAAWD